MSEQSTLNFYKWVIGTSLLPHIATLFHIPTIGMAWTGYAWFFMLLVSLYYLFFKPGKMAFPFHFWIPWIAVLIGYWLFDLSYFGLQATLQYLCFITVGFASSMLLYTDDVVSKLFQWFKNLALYFVLGKLISFVIPIYFVGGVAALAMTYCFFGAMGISLFYVLGYKRAWLLYLVPLFIVALMVTRMGILMMLFVGAFHFANKKMISKFYIVFFVAFLGLAIFNTEAFQKKAFRGKKQINLEQIELKNGRLTNINTNGRDYMWNIMDRGIAESPIFGHGSRAELQALRKAGLIFTECHSDYKAIAYDYGYFGLGCLFFGFIVTFLHLKSKCQRVSDPAASITAYAALTLFLVWIGFMYSDNIMKYASQFGNFHFCLIGMTYARIALLENDICNNPVVQ